MDFRLCTRLYTLYTPSNKQHRFGPAKCKALALSHFLPRQHYDISTISNLFLQTRKSRLRENEKIVQGHTIYM